MSRSVVVSLLLAGAVLACSRPAPLPDPRSLIVITIDTLRADHVNPQVTPVLDALARDAIAFDTAITVGPVTLPAHASLLTATYPPVHGVRDNQIFALAEGTPTYATWLRERGYATGAFVSAIVLDRRYGLDAGFDVYDDDMAGGPERSARDTLARAGDWLQRTVSGPRTPFFLWIHLFEPHAPYAAGTYAGEVTTVDAALGGFFEMLRARGLWDGLVLSVTSDHGESLGEHGESTHGFFVYDATLRIPWILKAPGHTPRRFTPQVRILDVLPTMAALAHAGPGAPPPGEIDGVDLGPFLSSGDSPRLEAYAETLLPLHQFNWSELRALRGEQFKYIEAPEPELYDVAEDPGETRNVLAAGREVAAAMQATLAAIDRHGRRATRRAESDPVVAEKFMSLGYIGYSPAKASGGDRLPDPKRKLDVYELTMSAFELAGRNRPAEALKALRRAEALDPAVTQVHFLSGTILGQQEHYAEAAAALERAVELNPRYVTARFKLALAYLRLGRQDRAERALRTVLDDEPRNFRAYHNLAAIAYSRGDLAEAERLERQALAIDPNYHEAWNTLGAIYVVTKRPAEAIQALETAIRLDPSSGQAHYNLALALKANGQAERARETARKACSLDARFCS